MTFAEYQQFVVGKAMLPPEISLELETGSILGALGLAGETGEVVDTIKKLVYHRHPYTQEMRAHIKDELGDVLWYYTYLCYVFGISLESIMERNVEKLTERYGDGVATPERSINRTA